MVRSSFSSASFSKLPRGNHQIHGKKKILPIDIQRAFRRTIRNLEPLLKSCLAAITKEARFTFQKRSKKMLNRIREQILSARKKATENNKNVCAKQNNFMTSFKYIKTSGKNQVCSVEIMNLPEHLLPAAENDWNKQPFSIR